jgi:type II secretory pathway predicted ATPase ExeA
MGAMPLDPRLRHSDLREGLRRVRIYHVKKSVRTQTQTHKLT